MAGWPDGALEPSPDVVAQRVGDQVVVVHLQTNRIFDLNRTASRFWDLACSGLPCPAIYETMLDEFDVDGRELAREIGEMAESMQRHDLLRPRKAG